LYNKNIEELDKYVDLSCIRPGQDVRYALDDSKLKKLGWESKKQFDDELITIIEYYKDKFIW
jgi:dTDP-D-glucose 4,6-dehydratase